MNGDILISSRSPTWQGVASSVPVGILSAADAKALLLKRSGQDDSEAAGILAEALGRLPLALEQAASYAVDQGISLAHYLTLFRSRQAEMLGRGEPVAYQGTVETVVSLSMDALRGEDPLAANILETCAFLGPDEIPTSLFIETSCLLSASETNPDILARTEAVGLLRRSGLLVADVSGTDRLHRLFQTVIREQLSEADRAARIACAVAILEGALLPVIRDQVSSGYSAMAMPPKYKELRLHVQAVVGHGRDSDESLSFANLLEIYATAQMFGKGGFTAAQAAFFEAVAIRKKRPMSPKANRNRKSDLVDVCNMNLSRAMPTYAHPSCQQVRDELRPRSTRVTTFARWSGPAMTTRGGPWMASLFGTPLLSRGGLEGLSHGGLPRGRGRG